MKITSKNVLRFVLYIAALEANSGCGQNGNVGPYSNRKIKCDPYVRLKTLAFLFSDSETLSKRRSDVYKKHEGTEEHKGSMTLLKSSR